MRAFIAVDISNKFRKELISIQDRLRTVGADIKWVRPENIHITIKFLGEVSDEKAVGVSQALDALACGYGKFSISLFRVGAFPGLDYPKVIWVGIDKNCSLVEEIAEKVDVECGKIGFERERRAFTSHITLGRVRSQKKKKELKKKLTGIEVAPLTLIVEELILFKSVLTPQAPVYSKFHRSIFSG